MQAIFDGHNDVLLRLWLAKDYQGEGFINGNPDTHIDAPRAEQGGFKGGFFAVFAPSVSKGEILGTGPLDTQTATIATGEMVALFGHLTHHHPDTIRQCRTHADIIAAQAKGAIAAILHFEGAEAIAPDLSNLEEYYAQGLRSIGPVWSRKNAFGEGVPLTFPGTPDQGGGLTDAGKALIRACDRLGIMLDVSHLNAKGFSDIAKISSRPLIATHSNVHSLCPSPRNLTQWQLEAIADSGGLVGVNFASGFLREDGKRAANTPLDIIIRHIDAMLDTLGEDGVALGSDFDGAVIPKPLGDCAGLPRLVAAMDKAGYGAELIDKICWGNWLGQIKKQIG